MPSDHNERLSLPEMIQVFSLSETAKIVRISDGDGRLGWLEIRSGNVSHASTANGLHGFEALVEMVTWSNVSAFVTSKSDHSLSNNIEQSTPTLLIDAFEASQGKTPQEPPYAFDEFEMEPVGLAEETAAGEYDLSEILNLTARLKRLNGFLVAHIIEVANGEIIDSLGEADGPLPDWAVDTLSRLSIEPSIDFTVVCSGPYIDFLFPPGSDEDPAMFCRLLRSTTNLGLAFLAANEFVHERDAK